ncbi:hypothetical protein GP486_004365 [Trichoglossum hirsutum]|uniref:Uncharacterized protein n=1 Tax=Trichoglossum hirsutum TaxID=265104 RepID=A0A9P8LBC0_9PEZI|nr:hypothetical protein GP486_004365 [Trichoglossum hirsutum]
MSDDVYDSDDYYPPSPPLTPVTIRYRDNSPVDRERMQEVEDEPLNLFPGVEHTGSSGLDGERDYLSHAQRDELNSRPTSILSPIAPPPTEPRRRLSSPQSRNTSTISDNSEPESQFTRTPLPAKNQPTAASEHLGENSKPRRGRQRKWDLPMLLRGSEVIACPDSGAEANFMSRETATSLGLNSEVDEEYSEVFVLGNGKPIASVGRVVIECSFARDPKENNTCLFHIFRVLVVPLIMGAKFLRETETFTRYKSRLQERAWSANLPLQVMHINGAKERFNCFLDSRLVFANADTGSEMDLMSKTYAESLVGRPIKPLESDTEVQFADGSTAKLVGQIPSRFSLHESSSWTMKWFYVLAGLSCDVLLGDETLEDIDAFNLESSICLGEDDDSLSGLNIILWLKRPERLLANWGRLEGLRRPPKRQGSTGLFPLYLIFRG